MDKNKAKSAALTRKKARVRGRIAGDAERPRLSVFRSERAIYGQIINDETGLTLVSASTISKDLRGSLADKKPLDAARAVGEALAEKAQSAGISKVVFDRNGRQYAGRLAALAEGARAKGLQF